MINKLIFPIIRKALWITTNKILMNKFGFLLTKNVFMIKRLMFSEILMAFIGLWFEKYICHIFIKINTFFYITYYCYYWNLILEFWFIYLAVICLKFNLILKRSFSCLSKLDLRIISFLNSTNSNWKKY